MRTERDPLPADRESVMATSGPITGIKDLKMVSKKLSGLQGTSAKQRGLCVQQSGSDFVYCLRRDLGDLKRRYDPYDLEIVASERARRLGTYHTVSAFSVSQVSCHGCSLYGGTAGC